MGHFPSFSAFPDGDLVAEGLRDLTAGSETVPAVLVSVGAARLREAGIQVPTAFSDPERRLYDLLSRDDADSAHGRYNALVRRLVSFEHAVEHAVECARP